MLIKLNVAFICCKEVRVNETLMYSYTFCDLASGNNFTVFSLTRVKSYDSLKVLQTSDIEFNLSIQKDGRVKLKPGKEV